MIKFLDENYDLIPDLYLKHSSPYTGWCTTIRPLRENYVDGKWKLSDTEIAAIPSNALQGVIQAYDEYTTHLTHKDNLNKEFKYLPVNYKVKPKPKPIPKKIAAVQVPQSDEFVEEIHFAPTKKETNKRKKKKKR